MKIEKIINLITNYQQPFLLKTFLGSILVNIIYSGVILNVKHFICDVVTLFIDDRMKQADLFLSLLGISELKLKLRINFNCFFYIDQVFHYPPNKKQIFTCEKLKQTHFAFN